MVSAFSVTHHWLNRIIPLSVDSFNMDERVIPQQLIFCYASICRLSCKTADIASRVGDDTQFHVSLLPS